MQYMLYNQSRNPRHLQTQPAQNERAHESRLLNVETSNGQEPQMESYISISWRQSGQPTLCQSPYICSPFATTATTDSTISECSRIAIPHILCIYAIASTLSWRRMRITEVSGSHPLFSRFSQQDERPAVLERNPWTCVSMDLPCESSYMGMCTHR